MSRSPLSALLATELLKLRTVRTPALVAAACVSVTLVLALQPVLGAGRAGRPSSGTVGAMLEVLDATDRVPLIALALGVLVTAGEHHHATLSATLLQAPDRTRLMVAKGLAAVLAGGALGLLGLTTVLAVGVPTGAVRADLLNTDIVLHVAGMLAAHPLYALLGAGFGAVLFRSQPLAVLLPVTWLLVLEELVVASVDRQLLPWSLTGATHALAHAGDVVGVLPMGTGAVLLTAWALLVLFAGGAVLTRADIT
jgi:ABC-2 type transport system permease protein